MDCSRVGMERAKLIIKIYKTLFKVEEALKNAVADSETELVTSSKVVEEVTTKQPQKKVRRSKEKKPAKTSSEGGYYQAVIDYGRLKYGISLSYKNMPGDGDCLYHCLFYIKQKFDLDCFEEKYEINSLKTLKQVLIR